MKQCLHGYSNTPTYMTWKKMKERCLNPNHKSYKYYGGRGIKIYKPWLNFINFLKDMGIRPKNRTIDRIDVNKGYKPSNCRWATYKQQANNKRNKIK